VRAVDEHGGGLDVLAGGGDQRGRAAAQGGTIDGRDARLVGGKEVGVVVEPLVERTVVVARDLGIAEDAGAALAVDGDVEMPVQTIVCAGESL
jgi:hypothetical protein